MLELAGECTFDSFSEHLATLDTFPGYTPEQDVYRRYRRWGFESAALDLALRQAGTSLHEAARPHGRADHVRRLLADGRAADDRPGHAPARASTRRCASSSTRRRTGPRS